MCCDQLWSFRSQAHKTHAAPFPCRKHCKPLIWGCEWHHDVFCVQVYVQVYSINQKQNKWCEEILEHDMGTPPKMISNGLCLQTYFVPHLIWRKKALAGGTSEVVWLSYRCAKKVAEMRPVAKGDGFLERRIAYCPPHTYIYIYI